MAKIITEDGEKFEYRVVVVEGADGVGKTTVVSNLCGVLMDSSTPFIRAHFPNKEIYSLLYSKPRSVPVKSPVQDYLDGKINIVGNPRAIAHLYTQDRLLTWYQSAYQGEYVPSLRDRVIDMCKKTDKSGDGIPYLILDRYTQSSEIYQGVDMLEDEQDNFCYELEHYEYDILGLPRPDFIIYLDGDTEQIIKSKNERAKTLGIDLDLHEQNNDFLSDCIVSGRRLALYRKWRSVMYLDSKGKRLDPEVVAAQIYRTTQGIDTGLFD